MEGKAQARLRLEQKEDGLQAAVNSSSCHLQATCGSLGMPVYVKKGAIDYRGEKVHVRDLAGSYGRSSFFVTYGLLEWQNDLLLALDSVSGTVDLGQLFALVAGIRGLPEWFYKTKNVRGSVLVQTGHLTGPLLKPSGWDYSADLKHR